MNATWTPDGQEPIPLAFSDWQPDGSGVPCAVADAGGLRVRAWRDSAGRIDAVAYNPATGPGVISGNIHTGSTWWTSVERAGGTGSVLRFGPPRKTNQLPALGVLHGALGGPLPDNIPWMEASQFHDKWPKPDVSGSPRIAQAEPAWLMLPHDSDWPMVRDWTDAQANRPMLYDDPPAMAVIGETGIGSSATWRNPDNAHLEVSRLAAGWLVFRDPVARWMLEKYGQMLLSRPLFRDGDWHGEETRALGLALHACAMFHLCLGDA